MKVKVGDLITFSIGTYPSAVTTVGMVINIDTLNYGPNHDRDPFYDSTFHVRHATGSCWVGPRDIRGIIHNYDG
jgi:hypothetical protein